MTDPITPARVAQLLDAYGADPRRWPEEERAGAQVMARTFGADRIAQADALDNLLFAYTVPAPGAALTAAVLAGAPRPRIARRARLWWAGLALAAAGAGGLAGSSAMAALDPPVFELPAFGHDNAIVDTIDEELDR